MKSQMERRPDGIRIAGHKESVISRVGTVQSKERGLLGKDFTFTVKLEFEQGDKIAYIGLGYGIPDRSYNGLTDSIYMRFHSPEHGEGLVGISGFRLSNQSMGHVKHGGSHTVSIIKEGDSITFYVDPESDGPTDDDLELVIPDIREHASFFNSKNMPVFFAGSGTFQTVSLKVGEAIYP